MKTAWRVQYKPVPTMGWHPGKLKATSLEEAQRYADHLRTIHPAVRVVGVGNVVVYIPECRPLARKES